MSKLFSYNYVKNPFSSQMHRISPYTNIKQNRLDQHTMQVLHCHYFNFHTRLLIIQVAQIVKGKFKLRIKLFKKAVVLSGSINHWQV